MDTTSCVQTLLVCTPQHLSVGVLLSILALAFYGISRSGLPDIDLDDLRANTEYSGYSATSPVVRWFWEAVTEMDKQQRAQLVQFVTGTSKVPLEGFKALQGIGGPQKFQIHKAYGDGEAGEARVFDRVCRPWGMGTVRQGGSGWGQRDCRVVRHGNAAMLWAGAPGR